MKLAAKKSIRMKLFFMVSVVALFAISVNTAQTSLTAYRFFKDESKNNLSLRANSAAIQIESILESHRTGLIKSMQSVLPRPPANRKKQMKKFIKLGEGEIVSYMILRKNAQTGKTVVRNFEFTSRFDDPRFEDVKSSYIQKHITTNSLKWSKKFRKTGNSFLIQPLAKDANSNLPLLNLGINFPIAKSKDTVIAIITIWKTKIIDALGKSETDYGLLSNRSGLILATSKKSAANSEKTIADSEIFKLSKKGQSKSGFVESDSIHGGQSFLGAFQTISKINNLIVVSQKSSDSIFELLITSIIESLAWGLFILICGLGFAFYSSQSLLSDLGKLGTIIKKIAGGDFSHLSRPRTEDEIGSIGDLLIQMAQQIQGLAKSNVAKARQDKELDTSKIVQTVMFPRGDIQTQNLMISGFYQSADKCGGDLWGHVSLGNDKEIIYIGDAMGKGTAAAVSAAIAYSSFTTITEQIKDSLEKNANFDISPASILEKMNRVIHGAANGKTAITFFIGLVDFERGSLIHSSAGHILPIVLPPFSGDLRKKTVSRVLQKISPISPISLRSQGTPLGVYKQAKFVNKTISIAAGDKIFLYTDGLIQCTSPKGRAWGHRALLQSLAKDIDKGHAELKDKVIERAFKYFSTVPLKDDVTVVMAEISKSWRPSVKSDEPSIQFDIEDSYKLDQTADETEDVLSGTESANITAEETTATTPEPNSSKTRPTTSKKSNRSEGAFANTVSNNESSKLPAELPTQDKIANSDDSQQLTPQATFENRLENDIKSSLKDLKNSPVDSNNRSRLPKPPELNGEKKDASTEGSSLLGNLDLSLSSDFVSPENISDQESGAIVDNGKINPLDVVQPNNVVSDEAEIKLADTNHSMSLDSTKTSKSTEYAMDNTPEQSLRLDSKPESKTDSITKSKSDFSAEEKTGVRAKAGILSSLSNETLAEKAEATQSSEARSLAPAGILSSISLAAATDDEIDERAFTSNSRELPPVPGMPQARKSDDKSNVDDEENEEDMENSLPQGDKAV